jgi:hypothetical protein
MNNITKIIYPSTPKERKDIFVSFLHELAEEVNSVTVTLDYLQILHYELSKAVVDYTDYLERFEV